MSNIYIKFPDPSPLTPTRKKSLLQKIIMFFLKSMIPYGNPNFDSQIDNIKEWMVEFLDGQNYPNREIGLDISQTPIMIMPWRKNYGYWIDNNFRLEDFIKTLKAREISKEEFEKNWKGFEEANEDI